MKQPLLGHLLKQAAYRQCQITQEVQLRFDLGACHDIWVHFEVTPSVEEGKVLVTTEFGAFTGPGQGTRNQGLNKHTQAPC